MRINHNIPSLRALNQLDRSNSKLDKTLERLSSGLRINQAADDAAGLAITQKMDTQVRGLEQANRNAMDGISLIQTAEGALNEVHSMLQRVRELAVQVSNGTYTAEDREAVQAEVDQLLDEVQRISDDIEFNGMKLLNGDLDRRAFSTDSDIADIVSMSDTVGAGDYILTIDTAATKTEVISGVSTNAMFGGDDTADIAGAVNINGQQVDIEIGDTSEEVYAKLRNLVSTVDISIQSDTTPYAEGSVLTFRQNQFGDSDISITGDVAVLEGLGLDTAAIVTTQGEDVGIDSTTLTTGNGWPEGTTYTSSGQNIIIESNEGFALRLVGGEDPLTATGSVTLNILETGPLDLQIGANEGQLMEIRIQNLSPRALGITDMNLSTPEGAQEAITTVDDAIIATSQVRSKLGAYQNRLEHTVSNLDTASENMTASLSRILDADMAYEMSQFTQQSIIQQAGTSMLAQANQRPQSLLQLLQG